MNCGHSSDLIVYWGNEPFCLMCEHQELKEKLADAETHRERGKAHAQERVQLVQDLNECRRLLRQCIESCGFMGLSAAEFQEWIEAARKAIGDR